MALRIEDRFRFAVVADVGVDNRGGIVGDSLQVTTDGGIRIYLRKRLVGAVKPGGWKQVILQETAPRIRQEAQP